MITVPTTVKLRRGDISTEDVHAIEAAKIIAWDIETTGLKWRSDTISTCQVFIPDVGTIIVQMDSSRGAPPALSKILQSESIRKIFHFAVFDLSFMVSAWGVEPVNVACTKVASRLLNPSESHSLADILARRLNIRLDKSSSSSRTSNWDAPQLLADQIEYAANDVRYLLPLFKDLRINLARAKLWPIATRCFAFLPDRVKLELSDVGDVFRY